MTSCRAIVSSWSARPSQRSRPNGRYFKMAAVAFVAAILISCIPVPYVVLPGPLSDSRTNVPTEVPTSIVVGSTTRREVLLALGEPDGRGTNDRWYSYGSAVGQGGAGVFAVGAGGGGAMAGYASRETVEFHRFLVRFTELGIVSDVALETKRCPSWSSLIGATVPCLDIRGYDVDSAASNAEVIAQYENVLLWTSPPDEAPCNDRKGPYLNGVNGRLLITSQSLILVKSVNQQGRRLTVVQHPDTEMIIPLSAISSVTPPSESAMLVPAERASVIVAMGDKSCAYATILEGLLGYGGKRTKAAAEQLRVAIKNAAAGTGIPPNGLQ